MPKTYLNPPTLFPSEQYGFSQIVKAQGGTTVYTSGQVGWDAQENIGDANDFHTQTQRTFANLRTAMEAAGGTMDDVVSLRIYLVGEHIYNEGTLSETLLEFFTSGRLPTSNWIGVAALSEREFLIEVEAVAVIE